MEKMRPTYASCILAFRKVLLLLAVVAIHNTMMRKEECLKMGWILPSSHPFVGCRPDGVPRMIRGPHRLKKKAGLHGSTLWVLSRSLLACFIVSIGLSAIRVCKTSQLEPKNFSWFYSSTYRGSTYAYAWPPSSCHLETWKPAFVAQTTQRTFRFGNLLSLLPYSLNIWEKSNSTYPSYWPRSLTGDKIGGHIAWKLSVRGCYSRNSHKLARHGRYISGTRRCLDIVKADSTHTKWCWLAFSLIGMSLAIFCWFHLCPYKEITEALPVLRLAEIRLEVNGIYWTEIGPLLHLVAVYLGVRTCTLCSYFRASLCWS